MSPTSGESPRVGEEQKGGDALGNRPETPQVEEGSRRPSERHAYESVTEDLHDVRALAKRVGKQREGGSKKPWVPTPASLGTQGEDGNVDEQGFLRSQQQKAMDESRPAATRFPFCGAGSS